MHLLESLPDMGEIGRMTMLIATSVRVIVLGRKIKSRLTVESVGAAAGNALTRTTQKQAAAAKTWRIEAIFIFSVL
jgi:hypothetical protein